jgi:hypothetical protein
MAATYTWNEDTGTSTGSPAKGTTRTSPATDANWKNSGVVTDVYSSYPITAGNNGFQKALFGVFTISTFNQISAGLFAHTATAFGSNLTLKGIKAITQDTDRWLYVTPSASADTNLTVDMTTAIAIGSGVAIWFGATGPEATGKAATMDGTAARYSVFLTTQLQTAAGAAAGDTAQVTLTLQYNEN